MIGTEIHALLALAHREAGDEPMILVSQTEFARLLEYELIDSHGIVNEKGQAYIAALEGVPLPVQRWCLPADYGRRFDPIEVSNAVAEQQAGPVHGSRSARSEVREESGDQAERGAGVQPSGRKQRPSK